MKQTNESEFRIVSGQFLLYENSWRETDGAPCWGECHFDRQYYDPYLFELMEIEYFQKISSSVEKRQAEFLAGRYAAKLALASCNYSPQHPLSIAVGKDRCPIWPKGFLGSISHCDYLAFCAVASSKDIDFIGIDVERCLTDEVASQIAPQIRSKQEQRVLESCGLSDSMATTLLFSAKESFFKAVYPQVGCYFGFDCVRLADITFSLQVLLLEVAQEFAFTHQLETTYKCHYRFNGQFVLTDILGYKLR